MARGTQLDQLVSDLRAETGRSTSVSQGQNQLEQLKTLIRRTQERLYQDYDWPFLIIDRDESLVAGSRYYNFDSDFNYERIFGVWVKYADTWRPVEEGIGPEHYNIHDSDDDERQDPVMRWRHYESSQYEVWPIPSDNSQTLRMRGVKNLPALTDGSDTAVLDDRLIVLFAAAELLERDGMKDAQIKAAAAQRLYTRLRGLTQKADTIIMGGGLSMPPRPRFYGKRI